MIIGRLVHKSAGLSHWHAGRACLQVVERTISVGWVQRTGAFQDASCPLQYLNPSSPTVPTPSGLASTSGQTSYLLYCATASTGRCTNHNTPQKHSKLRLDGQGRQLIGSGRRRLVICATDGRSKDRIDDRVVGKRKKERLWVFALCIAS